MIRLAALLLPVLSLCLAACGGGGGGGGGGGRTIKLKGRIAAPVARMGGALAAAPAASEVTKVILVRRDEVTVQPVVGGAFEFDTEIQPAAVILAGAGDVYLGFVALRGTIPNIPLQAVDDSVTQLDLGTLVANGTVFEPGVDPIGRGLTLSDAEITALSEMGFVARMILADPDVDGDGAIDYLQGRQYSAQVGFARDNGTIPALTGVPGDGSIRYWGFGLNVVETGAGPYPPYVGFTPPAASGIAPFQALAVLGGSGNAGYFLPQLVAGSHPATGVWSVAYRDRTLAFDVPDTSGMAAAAPTLVPTVSLNADLTVQKVSWVWRYADGTTTTVPARIAEQVGVQLNAGPSVPRCAASPLSLQNDQVYGANVPAANLEHTLACQNIPWGGVTSIQLMFIDVFNNNHFIVYQRP